MVCGKGIEDRAVRAIISVAVDHLIAQTGAQLFKVCNLAVDLSEMGDYNPFNLRALARPVLVE